MKIEKQVCSLPLAKRLKELGIIQDTHYWWDEQERELYRCIDRSAEDAGCYAAFSGTELGVLLPDYFIFPNTDNKVKVCRVEDAKYGNGKHISYVQQGVGNKDIHMVCYVINFSEVEARAIMLVYLLEHKLVTAAECNERFAQAA